MSSAALVEAREKVAAKQKHIADIFAAAKTDSGYDFTKVKGLGLDGDQAARVDAIRAMNDELGDLQKNAETLAELDGIGENARKGWENFERPSGGKGRSSSEPLHPGNGGPAQAKSMGELFVTSDQFKNFRPGTDRDSTPVDFDLAKDLGGGDMFTGVKTLMTSTAGWAPEAVRTGKMVDFATRPVQLIDMIPGEQTSQNAVVYMEETTFTNNAAETAEGGTFPEAALVLTERTSPVRKITVWLPVTDEQLEDVPQVQSYINNRLGFMLRQRLDAQIDVGDGIAPNLEGYANRSGIQTQAKGTDPVLDAILRAKTKVRVTGRAVPNVLVIHPNDLTDIAITRTTDGIYILGNPDGAGVPERIWGMRVVESDARAENTAVVADTTFMGLAIRRNVTLKITDAHADFFINGKQAVRADMRAALQVYRPSAICKVTGI